MGKDTGRETVDFGTPGMTRHFTVVPKVTRGMHGYNAKVVDETEIDRMLLSEAITVSQHASLEALLLRLRKMGFTGIKSPNFDAAVHVDPAIIADKRAQIIRKMAYLFTGLDREVGRARRMALVNLVLMDEPWQGDDLATVIKSLDKVMAGFTR